MENINAVVITGNLTRAVGADTAVMGLIANSFARVRHYGTAGQCGNVVAPTTKMVVLATISRYALPVLT